MNILLVKLKEPRKKTQKPTFVPPIGLWSIQANVHHHVPEYGRGEFHRVRVIDLHLEDNLGHEINDFAPDMIGLSVQFSIQHHQYQRIVKKIRETWRIKWLIAGGFHAAAVDPPKGVDEVIKGAGESYFLPKVEFDDLVSPSISRWRMEKYWTKKAPHDLQKMTDRWMPIETSRGCSRDCEFCGVKDFWGKWKGHSAGWVDRQIEDLHKNGVKELFIEDDNIAWNKKRFENILRIFDEYKMWWSCPNGIQINTIKPFIGKLRRRLSKSGCWRLSLPFETGCEKTAELMRLGKKWIPFDEACRILAELKWEGIQTCGFFIIGYPGETIEDMEETLRYANGLPLDQRNIYIATPYPGTDLYRRCADLGWIVGGSRSFYSNLLYTKGLVSTPDWNADQVERIRQRDREEALRRKALRTQEDSKGR